MDRYQNDKFVNVKNMKIMSLIAIAFSKISIKKFNMFWIHFQIKKKWQKLKMVLL